MSGTLAMRNGVRKAGAGLLHAASSQTIQLLPNDAREIESQVNTSSYNIRPM